MNRAGRRLDCLLVLANELGVTLEGELPHTALEETADLLPTPKDHAKIQDALTRTRNVQFQRKSHLIRGKPSTSLTFTVEEATAALESLVEEGCSAAAAEQLIRKGADVNFSQRKSNSFTKKVRKKDQEDTRSKILETAVQRCDSNVVKVLARAADQASCNGSLSKAIDRGDADIVKVMILRAADPNLHAEAFRSAVLAGNAAMVCALSSGPRRPSAALASANLFDAVKSNQVRMIQALLSCEANADTQTPSAILWAAKSQQGDSIAALCLAKLPPSPEHLGRAISVVCEKNTPMSPDFLRIVEILLVAGAHGGGVADSVLEAARRGQHELLRLLVNHSDFDSSRSPDAIKKAIMAGDLISFQYLASMPWDPSTRDDLLLFLPTARSMAPLDIRCAMANLIVAQGASQAILCRALLDASENGELDLAKLLVEAGASVDYEAGRACTVAVLRRSPELLSALIKGRPSTNTLLRAVRASESVPSSIRPIMLELLLSAGAVGTEVDEALQNALEDPTIPRQNYGLIKMLVSGFADVNVDDGACLTLAITRSDVKALKLLVTGSVKPSARVLRDAFMKTSCINPTQLRFDFIQELLRAGARGEYIASALTVFIDGSQSDSILFVRLLLEYGDGDINYNHGHAVCQAVTLQYVDLLHLLLQHNPSLATLNNALNAAMQIQNEKFRLEMCDVLLESGARGNALDEALATASGFFDLVLVRRLLAAGASIDFDSGRALRTAIAKGDDSALSLLIGAPCHAATLFEVLAETLKNRKDESRRLSVCEILLRGASGLDADRLGALLHEAFNEPYDLRILELFLEKGASVNRGGLEAIRKAVKLNYGKALESMLDAFPTEETVRSAFEFAWNAVPGTRMELLEIVMKDSSHRSFVDLSRYLENAVNEKPPFQPLISFLIHAGALVGSQDSQCMRDAAARFDRQTLELLLRNSRLDDIAAVFEATIILEQTWLNPSGITILSMLLENGAYGVAIDQALLLAVERFRTHPNASAIVDLLVTDNASPASSDYRQGLTFAIAARTGDKNLIEKLFDSRPSESTVQNAFPYVFKSNADETTTTNLIDSFLEYSRRQFGNELNINANNGDSTIQPVLFLCLRRWPRSTTILSTLLKAGASVDKGMEVKIQNVMPAESMTPLLWTLTEQGIAVDETLITMLIENDADTNFTTTSTKITPLLAAVCQSRVSVVKMLLLHGADPSSPDRSGWTPLRHASALGDPDIMKALIKSASTDDGSLQEAVGNLQHTAARLLLEAGHDPNYVSVAHDMRACLEHLVRKQPVSNDASALKSMFKLLLNAGANARYHFDGKSLLIIALDMPHAIMVVPALLSAFMGVVVNEEFNQHQSNGFVYSPSSYIIHQKQLSSPSLSRALLQMLRSYGCEDVYYSEIGPQPIDYTHRTCPRPIVDREDTRRRRLDQTLAEDADRLRTMTLENADRQRRLLIAQDDETTRRRLAFEAHERHLTYERERAQASDANTRVSTTLRLQLQSQEHAQTQHFALISQQAQLAHTRERNRLQIESAAQESGLRVQGAEAENRFQLSVVDAKVAAERKMHDMAREGRKEQEAVEMRGHKRRLQMAKEEEKRLARAAEVMRLQAGAREQRYLTSGDEPD